MERSGDKNGPAQDRHRLNQSEALGERRNGRPKARWANTFRRVAGPTVVTTSKKTGHSGVDTHDIRRPNVTNSAHTSRKWPHQSAE